MDHKENKTNELNEQELEQVAGGMIDVPSFDTVTAWLKEAGDRAYSVSKYYYMVGRYSPLFTHINYAQNSNSNPERRTYVLLAQKDMEAGWNAVADCPNMTENDYNFIKDRLDDAEHYSFDVSW